MSCRFAATNALHSRSDVSLIALAARRLLGSWRLGYFHSSLIARLATDSGGSYSGIVSMSRNSTLVVRMDFLGPVAGNAPTLSS